MTDYSTNNLKKILRIIFEAITVLAIFSTITALWYATYRLALDAFPSINPSHIGYVMTAWYLLAWYFLYRKLFKG